MESFYEMLNNSQQKQQEQQEQQEQRKTESSTEYQKNKYNVLKVLSNILYYLGIILVFIAIILFCVLIIKDEGNTGYSFIGCLLGGISCLFWGMVGKCLTDIYNKLNTSDSK